MSHFTARFPQHNKPTETPTPQDYLDAAAWHYKTEGRIRKLTHQCYLKSDRFKATYRRFGWIPKRHNAEAFVEPECA